MQIIRRYKPFRTDKRLFNIGSLDTVNKRIKAVAKKCEIEKPISFHLNRHTSQTSINSLVTNCVSV